MFPFTEMLLLLVPNFVMLQSFSTFNEFIALLKIPHTVPMMTKWEKTLLGILLNSLKTEKVHKTCTLKALIEALLVASVTASSLFEYDATSFHSCLKNLSS